MPEVLVREASIGSARCREARTSTAAPVIRHWPHAPTATLAWHSQSGEVQDRSSRLQMPSRVGPRYLSDYVPVPVSSTRSSLRSARFQERLLIVPRTRTKGSARRWIKTIGPRGSFYASPAVWNSLPDDLRDPELSIGIFRNRLKTFLFSQIWLTTFLELVVHLLSFHFFLISSIVCRARQRDILLAGAFEMSWLIDWINMTGRCMTGRHRCAGTVSTL